MSEIHEEMEVWGNHRATANGGTTLIDRLGVEPASPGAASVSLVLEILGDGEAHTIETIDVYLELTDIQLSGCQIAACLGRLELDGHPIKMLGPYDIFGSPGRFKLERDAKEAEPCK